jgi:hypothetical protein
MIGFRGVRPSQKKKIQLGRGTDLNTLKNRFVMPLTTTKKTHPQNNANQVIQSFKPKLFMLFCQINQPQQNLLSLIAQLPVKKQLTPTEPKVFQNTLRALHGQRE